MNQPLDTARQARQRLPDHQHRGARIPLFIADSPTPEMAVHECIHIWQFERDDLTRMPDGVYNWKGALWPKTEPYRSRPWERYGFDLQDRW